MGKASKKRDCPAVGGPITPAECGERRISVYACPEHCPHNPFAPANYDQLLRIDDELEQKCLDRLSSNPETRSAVEKHLLEARRDRSPHALTARINFEFFFQTDAAGRTMTEAWEAENLAGLKNDERVVLRARTRIRVALLEVRRFPDLETVEFVDLLAPDQPCLRVRDRKLAASAVRFTTLVGWIYPMPHFWRAFGSAIDIPATDDLEAAELVTEIVRHLGGPTDEPAVRRWLAEHFARFDHALLAVTVLWRRQMFAASDAMIGRAVYELRRPFAECLELLDQVPEVENEQLAEGERAEGFADARAWMDPAAADPHAPNAALLGRVLLGQSHWRLETFGAKPLEDLKRRFEARLGDRVRFTGQRLDNFAAGMAEKDPKIDESLVPPRLRDRGSGIKFSVRRSRIPLPPQPAEAMASESVADLDRQWLDLSVPALNGQTPRAAAADPALRPRLIRLMKSRVRRCDERNLRTGGIDDVNWMLRELGLHEILFDPPPWRPAPEQAPEDGDGPEAAEREGSDLPFAPPPPRRPFTAEEIRDGILDSMDDYESAVDAIQELESEGNWFIREIVNLTDELLSKELQALIAPFMIQAWRLFVPRGTRGPDLDMRRLLETTEREVQSLKRVAEAKTTEKFSRFLKSGPQPELAYELCGLALSAAEALPAKEQPEPNGLAISLAVLRAVIEEIDTACRER